MSADPEREAVRRELAEARREQAATAIVNADLLSELQANKREAQHALEQQTATADILRIIASSPSDTRPVFDAVVLAGSRLLRCVSGIFRCDETSCWPIVAAIEGRLEKLYGPEKVAIDPEQNFPSRAIVSGKTYHLPDWSLIEDLPEIERGVQQESGLRSTLYLPLMRSGQCLGLLAFGSLEAHHFGPAEITVAESFRDQALIAIENTRLFTETRDALQRQTATADVLRIISRSVAHAAPVFDTILESCARLFDPYDAAVYLVEGDRVRGVAHRGVGAGDWGADSMPLEGSSTGLAIAQRRPIHFPDLADKAELPEDKRATLRETGGMTVLYAPMISQDRGVGSLVVTRRPKKPFAEAEIALIQTFADQAVIAIENARLFAQVQTRTRELEQSLDDLRKAQDRLVQTEKLASLGQLTAGIAHEIKNPLNFVNNFSALSRELLGELKESLAEPSSHDVRRDDLIDLIGMLDSNLDKIAHHGKRADAIVRNMLLHSREGSGERRNFDVNRLVEEVLNLAWHGTRVDKPGFDVVIEKQFDAGAGRIEGFPQELTRVLINLIGNGFHATQMRQAAEGAAYQPTITATTVGRGDAVEIRVRDNGTGIADDVKAKMFNPFFTTKPAGQGTGLGLSLSHDIVVKQHGGRIDVQTEPGAWAEFVVTLPRVLAEEA